MKRRLFALLLIGPVILLGLSSRQHRFWPDWFAAYAGDTLWALLVYLLLVFLFPARRPLSLALWALGFAFAVEFSQLFHPPWLDALRATTLGGLILGFSFLWSDLLCYSVGVGIGCLLDSRVNRNAAAR